MLIDGKKVNLEEKDLEDWLWENPDALVIPGYGAVVTWIGRQFKVPSGIIDLLGYVESGDPVVVELKNREVDSATLTQVSRYAADIQLILEQIPNLLTRYMQVFKVVIGTNTAIPSALQFEADALDVQIYSMNVRLTAALSGPWNWTEEAAKTHAQIRTLLAEDDVFDELVEFNAPADLSEPPEITAPVPNGEVSDNHE